MSNLVEGYKIRKQIAMRIRLDYRIKLLSSFAFSIAILLFFNPSLIINFKFSNNALIFLASFIFINFVYTFISGESFSIIFFIVETIIILMIVSLYTAPFIFFSNDLLKSSITILLSLVLPVLSKLLNRKYLTYLIR